MKIFNYKIIVQILFVIIFLSTSSAKSLDKFDDVERVSDYFSGIVLLNDNQFEKSLRFLGKLEGLEKNHKNYSKKYLYSLVNSGNFKEAFNYSKKIERQNLGTYESNLISGIFYLKNNKIDLARKYFIKANNKNSKLILNNYVSKSLYNWSNLTNQIQAESDLKNIDDRFSNLKKYKMHF